MHCGGYNNTQAQVALEVMPKFSNSNFQLVVDRNLTPHFEEERSAPIILRYNVALPNSKRADIAKTTPHNKPPQRLSNIQ
jgi:hypothetical protein